ncbi:MFS transporter [Polaromonas sp. OV174]|uniref:CynX/NimT family MFS transporter n=1 Tax=Polaromonas sp. OV174 TaxID=1855300 RepID=UPI000B86659D|nr:MFS transporter [Polaromonas sp. OV174]
MNSQTAPLAHEAETPLVDAEILSTPAPDPTPAPSRARRLLLAASLVLIALNLRPVFSSLSVLLPEIMKTTGLSPAGASLLTTLPVLCLGLFAFPAPALARRFGAERTLLGAMLLVGVGTLLRGSGSLSMLFLASAVAGAGIGVANVLLPGLVKRDFAKQAALMTGLYTLAICAGAAGAAAFSVPLQHHLAGDSWQLALAAWALPAAVVLLLWAPQALPVKPKPSHSAQPAGKLWHDRLAWQVTGFMGLQSALAYAVLGWLAPILRERGLDASSAGYVVSAALLVQVATCLLIPTLAVRMRDQRLLAAGMPALVVVSMLSFLFAPLSSLWFWALLLGCGQGGIFSLALTLIVLRAADVRAAAQLSSMAQGVGYLISISGPLFVGLLRGWTGSFASSALLFVVLGVLMIWCGLGAGRALLVQPR